jgi:O-antigen/teichoic acid export membrane protein
MALILLPLVGILFFLAEEIVGILLGDQWLPSVTCLKLLTIAGALATFGRLAYPVFLALGRPKYETLIQLASLFCLVIFIYPLTKEFGINGAAGALCLSNIVVWYLSLSTSFRVISCTKKAQLKPIVLSFIATSIMGGVIIMEKKFLGSLGKIWFLMISLPTGLLVYMGVLYCMEKKTGYFIMRPFFERLRQAWKELPPWFPL